MKYSVATYLGFAITGLALIVKGLLPTEVLGAPVTFMTYTATIMNTRHPWPRPGAAALLS